MLEAALLALALTVAQSVDDEGGPIEDAPVEAAPVAPLAGDDEEETRDTALVSLFDYQLAQVSRSEVAGGDTRVAVETNAPTPRAGSFPVRFFIDNTSGPRGVVQLVVTSSILGSQHEVRRRVEVNAGERRVVSVPVASEFRYGRARATGAGIRSNSEGSIYFHGTYDPQRVVLSLSQPEQFEAFVGKKPRYSGANVQVHAIPPAEAPSELASYLGYDAVVVPDGATLDALDEAQRRAVEQYVATGGSLLVGGAVRSLSMFPLLDAVRPGAQPYGFGALLLSKGTPDPSLEVFRAAMPVSPSGPQPDYARRWDRDAARDLLLPQATAPLGRFLFIITLFTLAIGPGSVWIARRRGPATLLVTIPGTALVTCVAIIAYSVIADGFTVHASVYGYTLLDSKQHRAITQGVTAYYANLAPAKAVFGPSTMVVAPHADQRERYIADLEWSDGLRLGGDFVPSRMYREWGLVSVEPTRARLVLARRGDRAVLQNALGLQIDEVLLNHDGRLFTAKGLRDGAEGPLEDGDQLTREALRGAGRFGAQVPARVVDVALAPGEFLARVSGQGFVPSGGVRAQLHEAGHWVRGRVEP